MRYLGLDLGKKRIGIALSDKTGTISTPYKVILSDDLFAELKEIINFEKITDIIIGFPKNMNNTIGPSAKEALTIKKEIEKQFLVNVYLQDERRTTIAANETMQQSNVAKKKRKQKVDQMAASIILQTFLDRREKNGRKNDF